jgi:phage shock protein C
MQKRLFRSTKNVMISGVCGGIAEYAGIDPSIIRILWVVLTLASVGVGLIAYIACAIILPKDTDISGQ